jgi:acyl dehydratase
VGACEFFRRDWSCAIHFEPDPADNSYGFNKIRFPAPVPTGSRIRARAEVVSVEEKGGGWYQVITRFTLEVEGGDKPCFVGDSVTRVMAAPDA